MIQFFAALTFLTIAGAMLAFIAATFLADGERIVAALSGEGGQAGVTAWTTRVRAVSRPAPAMRYAQPVRVRA